MKITVVGLWHLGCVTAACTARHFEVIGLDFNADVVEKLRRGEPPLFEPGLDDLVRAGLASGRLAFTTDVEAACSGADLLWVAHDTPVDEDDRADVQSVLRDVRRCAPALPTGTLVLLSAQLPVGTCRLLEKELAALGHRFACSPENLCLGDAISIFSRPDRIVIGCQDELSRSQLADLFRPFSSEMLWMSPESAEMTKHSINAFLALSITFINEVARLCDVTGADAKDVERGLKSERRIGPRAYLSPSGAFAGGTLARDVVTFINLGESTREPLDVIPAIKRSNDRHRQWTLRQIEKAFDGQADRRIMLLGLTYKPGTNTLRRSAAVELGRALHARGYKVRAFDPSMPVLTPDLSFVDLRSSVFEVAAGADAIVVCTPWPEFLALDWDLVLGGLRRPLVIDVGRFLQKKVAVIPGVQYVTLGSPT
jgi:UDPglucose 6-dehydrogenase